MKKVLALVVVVLLLATMAPVALADNSTVYVSVSVDGKLEVAAQPVSVSNMVLDSAIKAAHAAYYSGGESGYVAGIDPTYNMFLITKAWGIDGTPYVIVNGVPLGSDPTIATADIFPIKAGDNIVIAISSDPMTSPAQAVGLTATVKDGKATITAVLWILDMTIWAYTSSPLASAAVVDPVSGASLGTTDANGTLTLDVPASGIIAIDGLAAIPVDGSATTTTTTTTPATKLPQTGGASVSTIIGFVGLGLMLVGASIFLLKKKQAA